MELTLKDIIYFSAYIVTVAGVFFAFKNRLINIEKELKRNQKIIFGDQGKLNLVDESSCKLHQDQIFAAIRKSETAADAIRLEIKTLNENVIRIMVKLEDVQVKNNKDKL